MANQCTNAPQHSGEHDCFFFLFLSTEGDVLPEKPRQVRMPLHGLDGTQNGVSVDTASAWSCNLTLAGFGVRF